MSSVAEAPIARLDPKKFHHPEITADGQNRASVSLSRLRTLWFNTGTLCNLTCANCYIESSPRNDRLAYLSAAEVGRFLDELEGEIEIGFTGGEPFMNPELPAMLEDALERGHRALVLTNAMRPMLKCKAALLALKARHATRLALRVSIDHYGPALHEAERGRHSWRRMLEGLAWLAREDFNLKVAGRTFGGEDEARLRAGYARLFAELELPLDATDPSDLVLFPEMDAGADVPEITEACWGILGVSPEAMMCASSRMVARRKGEPAATVLPCTLLPYDPQFDLGTSLATAARQVALNHPHCARFCVLGGGSCSAGG
jgi:MoaA/NifB/PqqE/SkfB family radical SAM enzyme